jgi:hopanoid biosynthesis associated membrane protein HpnM
MPEGWAAPTWQKSRKRRAIGAPGARRAAFPNFGGDTVRGLYDALLGAMKNGRTLGQSGRFTQLEPVICSSFDIAAMARLLVGSSWAAPTEAQRQQVSDSFARYISAIYADRFDSYAGQKLEVTGEQPSGGGVMVESQIVRANGEPVRVDYMMRQSGEAWLIADIYLNGAISEVATGRRDPQERWHRRPGCGAQPQGRHADRNQRQGVLTPFRARAS